MARTRERSSRIDHQSVTGAAGGLQIEWIGGIALDLSPEAIDLHVHGSLLRTGARRCPAFHGKRFRQASRRATEGDLALALGDSDDLFTLPEFSPFHEEDEGTEAKHVVVRLRGRNPRSPQDRGDAQQHLLRVIGLGEIVVDAGLEAADPGSTASVLAVSIRMGICERWRKLAAKSTPFSPGSITSSTMMSNSRPSRNARASMADAATVTRYPCLRTNEDSKVRNRRSSSTTSTCGASSKGVTGVAGIKHPSDGGRLQPSGRARRAPINSMPRSRSEASIMARRKATA